MEQELTGIGSEQSGNPNGGEGEAPKGSSAPPAANQGPGEPGNLDWAKAKGWLTAEGALDNEKLAAGYQSLEKRVGSMISMPDDKAKPEDIDAFHKKLGWPGEAKGYEFTRPEGLPENLPYDEGMANRFREWANAAKLPKAAAQSLHDAYVKQYAEDVATFEKEVTTKAKAAHETLVKDWGEPKSETYLQNKDAATRALRQDKALAGLEDELKQAGLLTKEGFFVVPQIAHLLAAHGKQMQNDSFTGNGAGQGGNANPFAKATENLTEQSRLIKSDPAKARALAQAAGWTADDLQLIR